MRRTAILLTTSALLLAPLSASAKARGFDSTISQPLQEAVKIEVVLSEDLTHRADNLPEKLRDRSTGSRRLNSGFSNNGFYGQKSLDRLVEDVVEELNEDFAKKGLIVSDEADMTLRVTLEDVKNNRPTFEQLAREPALSFQSFGLGGAELSAVLIDASGEELGTVDYRWFENNINNGFAQGNGVWTDAHRAISRFSRRTASTLAGT